MTTATPAQAEAGVLATTAEEIDVLRWGRNAAVSSVPRNVPVLTYKKATAVEVLVAHLYLTAPDRCAQLIEAAVTSPVIREQMRVASSTQQERGQAARPGASQD
ncbi:hypothetical protein GPECTOR_42g843 [Gonium pectorale]|uniref:Uncharacterized protein n=1 Tax=Gonium pectorale TaxID=33097 RepID=A0A150G9X2_GONPE|nr:hypothetical protein GPECTOR_42g843 [Gonium pectorale]|eukprot:KXZ46632.1 hypothetical protein GPECTOR_42g843 [Gonium pectorale]